MADDRLGGRRAPRTDDRGRVPFVWVEDDDTGHRYDVLETSLRPGMTPIEGVDLNYSGRARRPKYRVNKAGDDDTRSPSPPGTPPSPSNTDEDASTASGTAGSTATKGARK